MNPTNNENTKDVQPQAVQSKSPVSTSELVSALVSASKPNLKASIPYPSMRNDERNHEKSNNQIEKFYQIFKDMKKLSKMARTPLNEHCSAVLLKKLPEKLGDPDKFLIPCDFSGMAECLALADLDASINLMPFSVWKRLSLPDLTPTCMTLELADRSISRLVGVAEDVYVKVGSFHFSADFVVVDFDADPRVPLILGRSFLKTGRDLIDVFEGELTLRVGKEAIAFNLDQTSRYYANYSDMTAKRIDVIDMACEEYSQEVLEAFLNDDPSLPPPNQRNYLPEVRKELKICEAKTNKSSVDEPPLVELKALPPHLEYAFLEEDFTPAVQHQRRVNPKIHDVIKQEVIKLLDAGLIYPISDSPLVSLVYCVPKKGGFIVVENEDNELILTRLVMGWRACIDYRKLNEATRKDHFPLSFMDQMLERLAGNQYYCFLDGFYGYFQILVDPKDQEKTTFTCPYRTFDYRRMPFGLCNAPDTFQSCLSHLEKMLKRCEDTNLCLNWENSHFMVNEGIVLGHKISKKGIEVNKAKVDVISKLPHPTTVKGIRSFLGHAECVDAFQTLKRKLTEAHILIASDWDMPFELMCDASDFDIGAVLGQRQDKHFRPIHYASKIMTEAELNYTTTKKEMLAVVRCVSGQVAIDILKACHSGPTGGENRASWSDKLDDALWAFRTAYKTPIECTSYKLVYEKACHHPVELEHKAYWAFKHENFDLKTAGNHRKIQINELNELHDQAYENSLIYKEKTKRIHDSKIKNRVFNIGDRVLLFNYHQKILSGKLKSRWSGPFTISQVFPYGIVELSQPDGPKFKVNGHRLKRYFGEDVPKLVVPDLQTFTRDH
nr:DNA-directed DNA polymerase [Tanacetum cinerariifolium]